MHKTVTITLGGILFHVEDDAFAALDSYLSSIRAHFRSYPDNDEIVADIENRIAEEFGEKLKGKRKAVTLADVEELTARMGTVEDFKKFDAGRADETETKDQAPKGPSGEPLFKGRLYRSADDQILGGVSAGIAHYFAIDPAIVRLVFAATIIFGGMGMIVYILLWIILPEAKTTTEKLEMEQKRVTLSAIQERVQEKVRNPATRNAARKMVAVPVLILRRLIEALGKVLRMAVPLFMRAAGFFIILGIALAIAGLTSALVYFMLNPSSAFADFPLQSVVGRPGFLTLMLSGYALAFLPLIFFLMAGSSLMDMKNTFSVRSVSTLIALWVVALVAFTVTGFSHAPALEAAARRIQSERVETVTRQADLKDFRSVEVGGSAFLTVHRGDTYAVTMEAAPQDLDRAKVRVENGTLKMDYEGWRSSCFFFCGNRRVKLDIRMPTLDGVDLDGASHGEVSGFEGDRMTLKASGASSITGTLTAKNLTLDLSGASRAVLQGSADALGLMLSGASRVDAVRFPAKNATVDLSGASAAQLDVSESLKGDISGTSSVTYKQRPPAVDVSTSGASRVEQMEMEPEEQEFQEFDEWQ